MWAVMSASLLDIDGVPCVFSITRNTTDARIAEEKIRNLAFYDPLTNLPNRRLLMDRLGFAMVSGARHSRKRALLFVDLDNFKALNDTHGHEVGDQLLIEVANRLQQVVRDSDTVARFGGDEFIVLLAGLDDDLAKANEQVASVSDKIHRVLNAEYLFDDLRYQGSVSVGAKLILGDDADADADQILKEADKAMYAAKKCLYS